MQPGITARIPFFCALNSEAIIYMQLDKAMKNLYSYLFNWCDYNFTEHNFQKNQPAAGLCPFGLAVTG